MSEFDEALEEDVSPECKVVLQLMASEVRAAQGQVKALRASRT